MNRLDSNRMIDIMSGRARGPAAGLIRVALGCAEPIYAGLVSARNWLFDFGFLREHRVAAPVISVGNVTTGGTGKTPFVALLAERLARGGFHPAVLTRGYGAAVAGHGDEPAMLRKIFADRAAHVRVIVGADRISGARAAMEKRDDSPVDVFIMDDGFQHRRLARDLDIVLVDSLSPFGFGHILPRGLLREPLRGLRRAGLIVLTRVDRCDPSALARIEGTIRRICPETPIVHSRHVLRGFRWSAGGTSVRADLVASHRMFAFAGVGNPESFTAMLRDAGAVVSGHQWFPDHHDYTPAELLAVQARAEELGATALVTTAKDAVKLDRMPLRLPLSVAELELEFAGDGEAILMDRVKTVVKRKF